jgi:hypothetical protein
VTCHLEYRPKEERHGAFRRLKARPCESLRQTRTVRLCRGTHRAFVTCHLEYRPKEERHGAFRRLKARPCELLRAITPASVAVRCVASAGAATSAEPPAVVAVSAEDVALVVAEDVALVVAEATVAATGKKQR